MSTLAWDVQSSEGFKGRFSARRRRHPSVGRSDRPHVGYVAGSPFLPPPAPSVPDEMNGSWERAKDSDS